MPPEEPPYPSGRYVTYLISVLFLTWALALMDRQIVTLLLPALKADLGVSDIQASLIQALAFASMYAVASMPMGLIADRTNRRNLVLFGVAFWSVATIACGFAATFWQLFCARMAVGLGEACLVPACVSMMADYFRPHQRGRAMAALQVAAPIGSAASLFLGGMLLSSLAQGGGVAIWVPEGWAPWRAVFIAMGLPGLVVALLVASLREPPRRSHHVTSSTNEHSEPKLFDFIRAHPRPIAVFIGTYVCVLIYANAIGAWGPTVLMRNYEMAPNHVGAIYGAMLVLCSATAILCSGFISDALVRRHPLNGRMLVPLFILPMELCAQTIFIFANSAGVIIAALALSSVSTGIVSGIWAPAVQDLVPNRLRGQFQALLSFVGTFIGYGCGPLLVAAFTDHVFKDEMMLQKALGLVALSAAVLGFLLACALPRLYAQAACTAGAAASLSARPSVLRFGRANAP